MANRLETTEETSASSADVSAAAPTPASGGFKAWLPLVVTFTAMPLLAFGMTRFVLLPQLQKGLGITTPAASEGKSGKEKAAARESVPMNVGSSRVDLQACKLEYSIVSPK